MNCNHEALVDTGIGYYHCPTCKEGWTYNEWKLMNNNPTPDNPKTAPIYLFAQNINRYNNDGIIELGTNKIICLCAPEMADLIIEALSFDREQYARQQVERALEMAVNNATPYMDWNEDFNASNVIVIDKHSIMSVLNELYPEGGQP